MRTYLLFFTILFFTIVLFISCEKKDKSAPGTSGIITTIAGSDTGGFSGDGGAATNAKLVRPSGLAIDGTGALYFADNQNRRLRRISASGIISTIAGNGGTGPIHYNDRPATTVGLASPKEITIDNAGNLYISDYYQIYKINTSGLLTVLAGVFPGGGYSGDGGPATAALLNNPGGIAVDNSGNVYIAELRNSCIRKISTSGIINTVAGTGTTGYSGDGGPASAAQLKSPYGLAFDGSGNLYITETGRIRKIDVSGVINTIAGTGEEGRSGDGGAATAAKISAGGAIAIDIAGNIYIADGYYLRKIANNGIISTIAGTGYIGHNTDGGAAITSWIGNPLGITTDPTGNIYLSASGNARIRKISK